jgi:hypothetical protein
MYKPILVMGTADGHCPGTLKGKKRRGSVRVWTVSGLRVKARVKNIVSQC